jgi:T4 RnlA family RNA ligase
MFNTELGIFCSVHNNWKELLTAEPYNLKIKEDGPYVMFSYDQIRSDFNNPMVREARGIIFRNDQWEAPVCWAFNKFGNYGESYAPEINWSIAFVSEKVDGSLIKIWYDAGNWHISTNGTIDAFKAEIGDARMPNFGTYFEYVINRLYPPRIYRKAFDDFTIDLDENLTYMFELVGPYNRVVVPHDKPDLYFLGARNKYTGEEFNCSKLIAGALGMGRFKLPMQFKLDSLESCLEAVETFGWDEEGFVVCDAMFNRVKIKSPAYVMAHYARNNNVINRKHLIKVILMNEVEEFLCYAEDYREELEKVQSLMQAYFTVGTEIAKSCQRLYDIPKRTYAAWVQTLPKIYHDFAFKNYNDIKTPQDYTADWNENKWEACLDNFEKLKADLFGGN